MPLYLAIIIRHFFEDFADRDSANRINQNIANSIYDFCISYFLKRKDRLSNKQELVIKELLTESDFEFIENWLNEAITNWLEGKNKAEADGLILVFKNANVGNANNECDLYSPLNNLNIKNYQKKWQVAMSLRNIEPSAVIHVNQF
jgi:hypothetical protein